MIARGLLLVMMLAATAEAGPARIDWARGLVIADGVGIADRHAPNPAVARGTSRRDAEDAARKVLAGQLGELPLASGGTVAMRAEADKAIKARLDRAVATAITLAADPETDGAWRVTMAVPIEAVRLALDGPRTATEDRGPQVIVVEGVQGKPAVGWKVGGLVAPTLWVDAVPAWAQAAPRVTARAVKAGTIDVDRIDATPATLFVITGDRSKRATP